MKLQFVTFQPEHFNNNGDQGNIELLEFLAHSAGIPIHHSGPSQISEADFVLIGDASRAAMRFYEPGLMAILEGLKLRLTSGRPTLLIGSAYEFFAPKLGIGEPNLVPRISDYVAIEFDGEKVFGYQNSDTDLPALYASGLFVATKLFGPVLGYNPALLTRFANALGVAADLPTEMKVEIAAIRAKLALS